MKVFRRIALIMIVGLLLAVIFRGWLYRELISYRSIGSRSNYTVQTETLADYIAHHSPDTHSDIAEIIQTSRRLTSSTLKFTQEKCETDPNKLISTKKTNCIGYAALFSTVCNSLLEKHNLQTEWSAQPHIGQLYFLGINIHDWFTSAFLRDHDFVLIRNKLTRQVLAVDPTLADYTGIRDVNFAGLPGH